MRLTAWNIRMRHIRYGCYVDKDKNKVLSFNISPFELPEEELEKYFDILKSSLTGKIGGKLFNVEFPLKQEAEGGTQDAFCKLLNSKMDDGLLDAFYACCGGYVWNMDGHIR